MILCYWFGENSLRGALTAFLGVFAELRHMESRAALAFFPSSTSRSSVRSARLEPS